MRTTIITAITMPIWIYAGTYFAPVITDLARQVETVDIPPDVQFISWISMECPSWRLAAATFANIFTNGQIFPGIILMPIIVALFFFSARLLRQENRKSAERLGKEI